jgi:hypothetical protein
MRPVRVCCYELAIVTAGDDALAVSGACENAAAMDWYAAFGFADEKQRFLAEHKYRNPAKKMRTDHRRARTH